MRAVLLGVLVLLGLALPAMSHGKSGYADSWAVEVSGGEKKAQELAEKHGFLYRGPVSQHNLSSISFTLIPASRWEV